MHFRVASLLLWNIPCGGAHVGTEAAGGIVEGTHRGALAVRACRRRGLWVHARPLSDIVLLVTSTSEDLRVVGSTVTFLGTDIVQRRVAGKHPNLAGRLTSGHGVRTVTADELFAAKCGPGIVVKLLLAF